MMLLRWLMAVHIFLFAIVCTATLIPDQDVTFGERDWLWFALAAYILLSLIVYVFVGRRRSRRNRSLPTAESKQVHASTLGVYRAQRWYLTPFLGRLSLAVCFAQQVNSTIDREMVALLTPYNEIDFAQIQGQWQMVYRGFVSLIVFSVLGWLWLRLVIVLHHRMAPKRHASIRAFIATVSLSILFLGLVWLTQHHIYDGQVRDSGQLLSAVLYQK